MQTKLGFRCDTCTARDKEVRGCFTPSRAPVMAHGIKGSTNRCPVIDWHEANGYLQVYKYWRSNLFPNEGTWADQPNKLVLAMEYLDGIVSEST
jgi:hypothetical protein